MELYPLGISCQERVCGVFTDLSRYSLSKTLCSNCLLGSWPNPTETALWIEQDCPGVSVLFCSWMWPSAMTGEKAREPKHMNSWVQPVSPPQPPPQLCEIKVWGTTGALSNCPGLLAAAQMLFPSPAASSHHRLTRPTACLQTRLLGWHCSVDVADATAHFFEVCMFF